jgi:hypothetical protein
MESLGNSLLQRASFEQSLEVFQEGAVFGRSDSLSGATERIMVGQPANVGTGMVHIIADTKTEPRPHFLAPLRNASSNTTSHTSFIAPLYHKEFDPNVFASRVQESPRECEYEGIASLFAKWRTFAGTSRLVAQVEVSKKLSKGLFAFVLKKCKSRPWTLVAQKVDTRMTYEHQNQTYKTRILDFRMTHLTSLVIHEHVHEEATWTILLEQPATSVPVSADIKSASIHEVYVFSQNGFSLCLEEVASGPSVAEAEHKAISGNCEFYARVFFETPETMLQTRATNAQFVNAFLERMP